MASVPRALRHGLRVEHLIAVAVAAGFVALASAGGGYAIEVRAAGAILVWWAVLVAILLGGLPRAPLSRWALGAGGCLAGLALLTALSMSWASDDGRAFAEIVRVAGYLGLFVLAAISAAGGRGRPWLAGLAIGLLIVAGLALGSRLQPHLFPEQQLPTFIPNVKARVSYPLNYWNGLGACMALATVLLVWLSGDAGGRLRRAVAAGAIPIPVLTLFFTSSRGGFLALAVGLIVLVAATPRRLPMLGGLAFGALGAAVLVAVAVGYDPLVAGDIETELAERQGDELTLAVPVFFLGIAGLRWLVDGFL